MKQVLLAACAVLLATSVAEAGIITTPEQFFDVTGGNVSTLKLTNAEYLIKGVGNVAASIEVGDKLRGVFRITTSTSSGDGDANINFASGFELTGLFETEVAAIGVVDGGGQADFKFIPSTSFAIELATLTGGLAADFVGSMIAFFSDTTPDFAVTASRVTTEANASNGSFFMSLGNADGTGVWGTDYYWAARGAVNFVGVAGTVANFTASLQVVNNNTTLGFDDITTQVVPTGFATNFGATPAALGQILNEFGLQGNVTGSSNPATAGAYPLSSQDPIRTVANPEPSSMIVWGALSTLVLAVRRRRIGKGC